MAVVMRTRAARPSPDGSFTAAPLAEKLTHHGEKLAVLDSRLRFVDGPFGCRWYGAGSGGRTGAASMNFIRRIGDPRDLALVCGLLNAAAAAAAVSLPDELLQSVRSSTPTGVLVEIDTRAIDNAAALRRASLPRRTNDAAALQALAANYRRRKDRVLGPLQRADIEAVRDYSHLPLVFKRVHSEAALRALAARPGVRALHADRLHQAVLAQSLPLIGQPAVAAAGQSGTGTTVAVIDNGIDLAQVGCSAVATPASCRIAAAQTFVASPSASNVHGTNVAAIVLDSAPGAKVASLDVFSDAGALSSDVISAINWAIGNRAALNIVALNMSLGDTSHNTSPCAGNVFAAPITNARNAGLSVAVAAGNRAYVGGAFVAGLNSPACVPGALSVGAVYDSNLGAVAWSVCTDASSAADQVACFSNTASYLSLLAPGAVISAGGAALGGTSQATPHVAGALAVLRAAFPSETPAAIEARLSANGTPVTDPRTGQVSPRLNLLAAARPVNDDFANSLAVSGNSGTAQGDNRLATHEASEPQPAPAATQSVWWRWTAPAAGQVSLDTLGSGFDTRLDVYTGSTLSTLALVAGNDNADGASLGSSLRFQAVAGTTYRWAIDSGDGNAGSTNLQWSLNTSAQANLAVTLNGPSSALPGSTVVYALSVSNAGPQSATGVIATVAVPAGLSIADVPAGCSAQATAIACSIGELASGTSASFALSLHIDKLDAPVSLGASLGTEVPDPALGDNNATAVLATGSEADIPILPAWAAALLGLFLMRRIARGAGSRRPGPDNRPCPTRTTPHPLS